MDFKKKLETCILKLEEIRDERSVRPEGHGALITKEADSVSAMKFRMNKADTKHCGCT